MPTIKRHSTEYPGVYYISVKGARRQEKIYYIRYRVDGKQIDEKAGRQFRNDMTPARAAEMRSRRIDKKELPNKSKRLATKLAAEAAVGKWTVNRLWETYKDERLDVKSAKNDEYRYQKYIKDLFGWKEPAEIDQQGIDRLRKALLKKLKPQTVKHILTLLKRIINYGLKKGYIAQGLTFKIEQPKFKNIVTEDLSDDQVRSLLAAIANDVNQNVGTMLKVSLYTGMRRSEIFKLHWTDLDFRRDLIFIRDPKGGEPMKIPMNGEVKKILNKYPRTKSELVFPNENGEQRTTVQTPARRICEAAGLPKTFRPFHGLRHVYASMLASSGQVDMYLLQRLLTHKSPQMTQRYAELRKGALDRAANVAGDILSEILKKK